MSHSGQAGPAPRKAQQHGAAAATVTLLPHMSNSFKALSFWVVRGGDHAKRTIT
jgi:hypothetical protein